MDAALFSSSSKWQPWSLEALSMAKMALELTRQDWGLTGQTTTPSIENNNRGCIHPTLSQLGKKAGVEEIVERMVALLLIRMVALETSRIGNITPGGGKKTNNKSKRRKLFSDYSTTTICKEALQLNKKQQSKNNVTEEVNNREEDPFAPPSLNRHSSEPTKDFEYNGPKYRRSTISNDERNNSPTTPLFPRTITPLVIAQLRHYVTIICKQYSTPDKIPYHNVEHAYHVFLSANKLLDMMLCEEPEEMGNGGSSGGGEMTVSGRRRGRRRGSGGGSRGFSGSVKKPPQRPTFGIKSNPLSQLAFLFSALVHDVDHTGISNRQLVLEMDDLAILYNDQSVAEQRSLAVAFTTLKQERYTELREVLFPRNIVPPAGEGAPPPPVGVGAMGNEEFFTFRKLVIDLVLVTDIASPERTQIVKSKWKEAFGDVIVAEKLKKSVLKKNVSSSFTRRGSGSVDSRGRQGSMDSGRGRLKGKMYEPQNKSQVKAAIADASATSGSGENEADSNNTNNVNNSKLVPTRRKLSKGTSSGSIGESSSGGPNNKSSLRSHKSDQRGACSRQSSLQSLDIDESTRDSHLECDSIDDFSDSSHSSKLSLSSDIMEDDFDASAVSRTKMNFDNRNIIFNGSSTSNNSVSDGNGNSSDGAGKSPTATTMATTAGSGSSNRNSSRGKQQQSSSSTWTPASGASLQPRNRWSTGDLAGHVVLDDEQDQKQPARPKQPQQDVPSSVAQGEDVRWRCSASNKDRSMSGSFKVTPITMNRRQSTDSSDKDHRRQKSSMARITGSLSQSMLTTRELHLRPRAHSEERRLGVRRALDLAGSTVIAYSGSLRGSTSSNEQNLGDIVMSGGAEDVDVLDPDDDADEFKATVVLEQMIRAADVGALLQDWDNSMKWSTRLYKELKNGFLQHRGEDPSVEWYENQIKFLDFYILPLAKNLGVMGVFGENMGGIFAHCVKSNLARWIEEGGRATELMMKEDELERKRQWEEREDGIDLSIRSLGSELQSQHESLTSSFKSISSFKSCSSSTTNASNYGESGRKERSTKKLVDCCSLEVGEAGNAKTNVEFTGVQANSTTRGR